MHKILRRGWRKILEKKNIKPQYIYYLQMIEYNSTLCTTIIIKEKKDRFFRVFYETMNMQFCSLT